MSMARSSRLITRARSSSRRMESTLKETLWDGGTMPAALPTPSCAHHRGALHPSIAPCVVTTQASAAHGINDRGDIVGRCFDVSGKELGWFLRHDGSFAVLDDPSFHSSDGWAIDNSMMVVGDYSDTDDFVHGFTWTEANGFATLDFEDNISGLRAINQRGDMSGIYFDGFTLHGFLRVRNGLEVTIDPPGSIETDTVVVNNSRAVAGAYLDGDFNGHGYIAVSTLAAGQ